MNAKEFAGGLEMKFSGPEAELSVTDEAGIEGYASLFGMADRGGDVVEKGAFAASLARLENSRRRPKMLWQHDPGEPIGIWDDVREDARGLFVRGRILTGTRRGGDAFSLLKAGAIDGLSIGYRTVRANRGADGNRHLTEIDLWEVSFVTFPMLPLAMAWSGDKQRSGEGPATLAEALTAARNLLARGPATST